MERPSRNYLDLIDSYLALDNRRFIDYDGRDIDAKELCGTGDISDTFDVSILEDMLEDGVSLLALRDENVIGFFAGDIDTKKNVLVSEYTCATGGKKTGELLRYYALLKAYEINDNITLMTGSASGGIPAIEKGDSKELVKKKNGALLKYHLKRGGNLVEKMFTYTLTTVVKNIESLSRGSSKKKKTIKRKKKSKKKTRKRIYHGSGYWTSKNCGQDEISSNNYLKSYDTPKNITFYNIDLLKLVKIYNNQVKISGETRFKKLNKEYSNEDDYHNGNWKTYTEKMEKLIKSLNNEKYTDGLVKIRFSVLKKASDELIKGLKRLRGYKTLPKITSCSNRIGDIESFFNKLETIFKSNLKRNENLRVGAIDSNPEPGAPDSYYGTSYILKISRYQELVIEFFKELQRSHNSS